MPNLGSLAAFQEVVRGEVGYHRQSDGTTKYGRAYGPGFAKGDFCDMGQTWCAEKAGVAALWGHFAYVPSHRNWDIARNSYGHFFRPWSRAYWDWNLNREPNHITIAVEKVGNTLHLIEFNTDGGKVKNTTRPANSPYLMGYGYTIWPNSSPLVTSDTDGGWFSA